MLLRDRVVLVTGAGRGAGVGMARALSQQGAIVAVNYSSSRAGAEELVREIEDAGGKARAFQGDVLDEGAAFQLVEAVESAFGRLDAVVNNAIAGTQGADLEDAAWAVYANMLDYGCKSVVNTTRAALPAFDRAGGGRIVNVVTDFWNLAPAGWSPYVAGKGALVGLSRSLASELGPRGVTVNMVAPGWMVANAEEETTPHAIEFSATLPLRRRAWPEDVGRVVAFYVSDLAAGVTGGYLVVDGGKVTQAGL